MKDSVLRKWDAAGVNCAANNMTLVDFLNQLDYDTVVSMIGGSSDIFSWAHNPNNYTCPDATACANLFQFNDTGMPIPDTFITAGMMSVLGGKCLAFNKATGGMILDQEYVFY